MSREILDCLKRDICVKNVIHSQNTAFMFTAALIEFQLLPRSCFLAANLCLLGVFYNCVHLHSFSWAQNIKQFFLFKTVDLELMQWPRFYFLHQCNYSDFIRFTGTKHRLTLIRQRLLDLEQGTLRNILNITEFTGKRRIKNISYMFLLLSRLKLKVFFIPWRICWTTICALYMYP